MHETQTLDVVCLLQGDVSLILEEGDSVYYDAATGHKWLSSGDQDAEVLWVYAP